MSWSLGWRSRDICWEREQWQWLQTGIMWHTLILFHKHISLLSSHHLPASVLVLRINSYEKFMSPDASAQQRVLGGCSVECTIWGQGYPSHFSGRDRPKPSSKAVPPRTCGKPRCVYFGEDWIKGRSTSSKDWKTINSFPKPQLPEADRGGWESSCYCFNFSQTRKLGFQPFLEQQSTFLSSWKPCGWPPRGEAELGNERPIPWKTSPPWRFIIPPRHPGSAPSPSITYWEGILTPT